MCPRLLCVLQIWLSIQTCVRKQRSWKALACRQGLPKQNPSAMNSKPQKMSFIHQSLIKQWCLQRRNEAGAERIGGMRRRACQGHHMACFTLLSPVTWPSARSRYSRTMLQGITAVSSRNVVNLGWVIVFPCWNSAWAVFLHSVLVKKKKTFPAKCCTRGFAY